MPDLDMDMDRLLAPLLERPLADPEPLSGLEQRAGRARRRRRAVRLGGAATAAALAVAIFALLPRSADQVVRTTPPADAPPETGLPGTPFGPSDLRDPRTIHRGAVGGEEWQLLTGFDDEGRPCVEVRRDLGGTRTCGDDFYPERPFEQASATVGGTELRFGVAAPSVARMRLVLRSGTQIDARMIEPAPGYPVKVWFTSIPKGDRVRVVAPLDANGLPAGGG